MKSAKRRCRRKRETVCPPRAGFRKEGGRKRRREGGREGGREGRFSSN
jgi:hypothetical protein